MEKLDGSNRPSGIHSIISREQNDQTTTSITTTTTTTTNAVQPYPSTTMAATVVASPSFAYPSEPPPRYEVSSSYVGRSSSLHGLISPPESRRQSDGKNDPIPPPHRQSLPSIHEALGPKPSYSSPPSVPLPTSHELPFSKPAAPITAVPRSYPPTEQAQYASQLPPPPARQRTSPPQMHPQPSLFSRPDAAPSSYHEPPRHPSVTSLQTAPAPPHNPYTPPRYDAPRFEQDSRAPERVTNGYSHPAPPPAPAPATQPPYTYGSGPAPFPASAHQPPVFSQPRYQTRDYHEPWKGDKADPSQPARHGIKRNLDVYDYENNLAEINIASGALAEWSQHYNAIAQEQQRSINVLPDRMPTLESLKDMKRYLEKISGGLENLTRLAETQASEKAMLEQRSQDQGGRPGDYDDEVSMYGDDMKNHGYASEGKKRRGRAAPPGRCHSCNRAETPEWRRGPDGARTLCNACGLHYAKLTRKNTLNKSQSSTTSSLRPKSIEDASPRPL